MPTTIGTLKRPAPVMMPTTPGAAKSGKASNNWDHVMQEKQEPQQKQVVANISGDIIKVKTNRSD
jgi:hypothetical protein